MTEVTKWLTGLTIVALVTTVASHPASPAIITATTGGIAKIYSSVQGK